MCPRLLTAQRPVANFAYAILRSQRITLKAGHLPAPTSWWSEREISALPTRLIETHSGFVGKRTPASDTGGCNVNFVGFG